MFFEQSDRISTVADCGYWHKIRIHFLKFFHRFVVVWVNIRYKNFEKSNLNTIFFYTVMDSLCFLMKSQLFGEFPNLSNMNSDFTSETTVRNIEIPSSIFVVSEQVLDASA